MSNASRRAAASVRGIGVPAGIRALRLWSLFAGVALLVVGNGLQNTLIGVRAGIEGMPTAQIGFVMSSYFIGFAVASALAPSLVQQVGHIRAFAALASTASAVTLAFAFFVSPPVWMALRLVQGACYAGMIIVVESWLNASTGRAARGRTLAVYMIVVYAGWAASQPLLDLAPPEGFGLFALVSVCLSMALVPITLTRAGVPGVVLARRLGLGELYRTSPLALAGAFMLGVSTSAFFGMGPTFALRVGLAEAAIGSFLSMMLLGALAAQWPLGWVSDLVDRRSVIIGATGVGAGVAALLALSPEAGLARLLPLSALLGAATMPVYSICVAHANDHLDESAFVAAASGLILVYGAGSAIGPLGASLVMEVVGPAGLFLFMAATLGLLCVLGVVRRTRRTAVVGAEKADYVAVPQTSHPALRLRDAEPASEDAPPPAPR